MILYVHGGVLVSGDRASIANHESPPPPKEKKSETKYITRDRIGIRILYIFILFWSARASRVLNILGT